MAHHVFKETIKSYGYVWLILTQFFRELEKKKMYSYFMQDNATAHKANCSMNAPREVFSTVDNLHTMVSEISRFESMELFVRKRQIK
jgi:hypothetical protein